MSSRTLNLIITVIAVTSAANAIESPVGPLTTPQSSNRGGMTPNRLPGIYSSSGGISGNDIVTGNVSGMKAFRGTVPYGSSYYTQTRQENNVDAFLRRSSGSDIVSDRQPGRVQTYVSPDQATTVLRRGTPVPPITYNPLPGTPPTKSGANTFGLVPLEEAQRVLNATPPASSTINSQEPSLLYGKYRPLTTTPIETRDYISEEVALKLMPTEMQLKRDQQLKSDLEKLRQAQEQEQQDELTIKPEQPGQPEETQSQLTAEQVATKLRPQEKKLTVFQEMQAKIHKDYQDNLKKIGESRRQAEANEPSDPNAGQAKAIVGYRNTFARESKDRFNQLMKAAELYLKNKQFYKAADAYTLAATYNSADPLPYLGKCIALFAAGEYMSSTYWLSFAIEKYPDLPRFKVDLVTLLGGDKDLVQSRINEISQWQDRTGSGELLMLLAYIYLEQGNVEQAQMAINGAMIKMPEMRAVNVLDQIIHKAAEDGSAQNVGTE